jgi:DNA-binding MarR family transcriptional regulator
MAEDGKTVEHFLSYRLSVVSSMLRRANGLRAKRRFGLSMWESWAIAWLGSHPGLSLMELSRYTYLDKGQISRVVTELVSRGIVRRASGDASRGIKLSLTPSGLELYEAFLQASRQQDQEILESLTAEQRKAVEPLLDRLEQIALNLYVAEQDTAETTEATTGRR